MLESEIAAGDVLEIGTAAFAVTVPRMPCYKLGLRFSRLDMVKRFWLARRPGFYLSVVREGTIAAGDPFRLVKLPTQRPSIEQMFVTRSGS